MSYPPPPLRPDQERIWAILTHVIAGGLNLVTGGLFAGLVGAIVLYLVYKDRGPFIRQHAATTLNFQITLVIAEIIGLVLVVILIGWVVLFAVWALNIVFSILGALAASRGEPYRYPLSIPFFT